MGSTEPEFFLCYSDDFSDVNNDKSYMLNYKYLGPWNSTKNEINYNNVNLFFDKSYIPSNPINLNVDNSIVAIHNITFEKTSQFQEHFFETCL